MNTTVIDNAFAEMIHRKGVYKSIGITKTYQHQLRHQLRRGIHITYDQKLRLLQRSGWRQDDVQYSRKDLLEAIAFTIRTSAAAREFGPAYVLEKWELAKKG